MRRSGLTVDPTYIVRGDFTFEAGVAAMNQLMTLPQPPRALFCQRYYGTWGDESGPALRTADTGGPLCGRIR